MFNYSQIIILFLCFITSKSRTYFKFELTPYIGVKTLKAADLPGQVEAVLW